MGGRRWITKKMGGRRWITEKMGGGCAAEVRMNTPPGCFWHLTKKNDSFIAVRTTDTLQVNILLKLEELQILSLDIVYIKENISDRNRKSPRIHKSTLGSQIKG